MKLVTGSRLCRGKPRRLNTTAEDGEDDAAAKASGDRKRSVAVVLVTCEARRSRGT